MVQLNLIPSPLMGEVGVGVKDYDSSEGLRGVLQKIRDCCLASPSPESPPVEGGEVRLGGSGARIFSARALLYSLDSLRTNQPLPLDGGGWGGGEGLRQF